MNEAGITQSSIRLYLYSFNSLIQYLIAGFME